jgi:hypothetical protein
MKRENPKIKNTLMIDLETTGKRPGCCILTIGAAGIDKDGLEINFYEKIHHDKSKDDGFDDDPETIAWWQKQGTATLQEAFAGTTNCPQDVVNKFVDFVRKNFETSAKDFSIWSKGSDFDFPILKAYLDAYYLETPWPFWSQRDYRTLQAVFPFIKAAEKNGEKHNALEDAQAQMRGLITFMSLEAIFKEKPKNINKVTG